MSSEMNHWERVQAAIKGEEVDRVPVSLWRHWPEDDRTAEGLAKVMVAWQRDYDFDLVKFMPTGTYGVHDWGAETAYAPDYSGARRVTSFGLTETDQWSELERLDPGQGALGQEVEAIRIAAAELDNSVPILQTIFSPLTTAVKLAGEKVYADLRQNPEELKAGLQIIADVTIDFARACLQEGAHGFFFASQCTTYRILSEEEYREFGAHFDEYILNAVRGETDFNFMHVHGEDIMFDLAAKYPVEMINWHDRLTWPSLAEGKDRFSGLVVGGISEKATIVEGSPQEVAAQTRDAIEQTGGRRVLVGPGCVIPTNTPDVNVRAVIDAVQEMAQAG
jgi:uroporphyrinogen decarboxylase